MKPTPEQEQAGAAFESGKKVRINAYAGTGKTTTLAHISGKTRRQGSFLAFNKSIAVDARRKFSNNVSCSTTHGLAYRSMTGRGYDSEKLTRSINGGVIAGMLGIKPQQYMAGVSASGRQHGFLVVETLKRWMRSDADKIEPWCVPLVGKLKELPDKLAAELAVKLVAEATAAWQLMVDPKHPLPLTHDGYLKLWALRRPTIPGEFILLDEAQDTNGVVLGVIKHQQAQVIAVGDKHQCQPAGTMVKRVTRIGQAGSPSCHEYIPIEKLREGDRVVSWSMNHSHFYLAGDPVDRIVSRPYSGDLVVAHAGGKVSRYTPNHRCIAKLANGFEGRHFVYLMQKGENFRIGKATGAYESQGGRFGFALRAQSEQADAYWLISSHETDTQARMAEDLLSLRFGIPQLMFTSNCERVSQDYLDEFWSRYRCDIARVVELLREHGRDLDYPIWRRGEGNLVARRSTVIAACNLMDGMQLLNGDMTESKGDREWVSATISKQHYSGHVYSLKVANRETYVADGLMTHNSIYEWRGALNAMKVLPADIETRLSTSFRFGQSVATEASDILSLMGETLPLKGNPAISDMVGERLEDPANAILFRSNGRLIETCMELLSSGKKPAIVGGSSEVLAMLGAAEKLQAGQSVDYPLEFFGFKDWMEVEEASGREDGKELERWVRLFKTHGVAQLKRAMNSLTPNEADAEVILSTGHKAKGREWHNVRLCDDFLRINQDPVEAGEVFQKGGYDEELRLYYVAVTRAQRQLAIPGELQTKLETLWEYGRGGRAKAA